MEDPDKTLKQRLDVHDVTESAKVRSADDPQHAFALSLFQTYRTFLIHRADNEAVMPVVRRFQQALERLLTAETRAWMYFRDDSLFVNHHRVALSPQEYLLARVVEEDLQRKNIGGVRFNQTLDDQAAWSLFKTVVQDSRGRPAETCREWLQNQVSTYPGVTFSGVLREDFWTGELREDAAEARPGPQAQWERYTKALGYLHQYRRAWTNAEAQVLILRKLNRVIIEIIDALAAGQKDILAMIPGPGVQYPHETHGLHVALYVLLIGLQWGMPRKTLLETAHAALFHDIGRWPEEEVPMHQEEEEHVGLGLDRILKTPGLSGSKIKRLITIYEHHRRMDGTGYPARETVLPLHMIARAVAVADAFDRLTLPTLEYKGVPPFQAWGLMFQHAQRLDRLALKALYRSLGPFPMGSYVRLKDGRIAVVRESRLSPEGAPVCILQPVPGQPGEGAVKSDPRLWVIKDSLSYPLHGPPAAYWLQGEAA